MTRRVRERSFALLVVGPLVFADVACAAAQAASPEMVRADSLAWSPDGPGIEVAFARSGRGLAQGTFSRFAPGHATPLHEHGERLHNVLISGQMRNPYPGEAEPPLLSPGDFWTIPAGVSHVTECVSSEPCIFYSHSDVARPHDPVNLDERAVGPWEAPDLMTFRDGTPVRGADDWDRRRSELLDLLQSNVFGRAPAKAVPVRYELRSEAPGALDGRATRREVRVHFGPADDGPRLDLLLYLPNDVEEPVPVFLGLNFFGNHTIGFDPGVTVGEGWVSNFPPLGITDNRSNERSRGSMDSRWPVEAILERGYGLATANYGDLDPDFHDGFANGVHGLFEEPPGPRDPGSWGSVTAWAWGLSRILDYLETDPLVDPRRVALVGHSRLGRTALWAAARDRRFAAVFGNNALAGLYRRDFGETVGSVVKSFPHWFAGALDGWVGRDPVIPWDNHMVLALVAPRPLYLGTAEDDVWAPPDEEFLALALAAPAWRILGVEEPLGPGPGPARRGLRGDALLALRPPVGTALVDGPLGFHTRPGGHDITPWDWERYLDFADRHLRR